MLFTIKTKEKIGLGFLIFIAFLAVSAFIFVLVDDAEAGYPDDRNLIDWGDNWHRPRGEVRLNVLGQWSDNIASRLQGVCYDVMEESNKPYYLYLGLGLQSRSLTIEPTLGWSFRDNELIIALRAYPKWDNWRGYSNAEYQVETESFYYLAQMETRIIEWVEWGFEVEGWGDLDDHLASNGVGINTIFNLQALRRRGKQESKLNFEASIQYREIDGQWKPQAIVRLIFTPKMEEHTPDKRRDRRRGRRRRY